MIKKPLRVFSKAENPNAVLSRIFKMGILISNYSYTQISQTDQSESTS